MLAKSHYKQIKYTAVFLFSILAGMGFPSERETSLFKPGEIISEVKCRDNVHSYSLYLPLAYSSEKKSPVLFFLDPAARSEVPLELFKEAADKYGYILVCSRQFRDGPYEANNKAMMSMWQDVRQRFAVDPARCYASGFSGGARAATRLQVMTQKSLAGIIACGAGLDLRLKAADLPPALFIATIGLEDFNYKEMVKLDSQLTQAGVEYMILLTGDKHRWPDAPDCTRTVEWIELQAMKTGTRPKDPALVESLYQKELSIVKDLEAGGNIYRAVRGLDVCIALFKGLREIQEAEKKKKRITATNAYKSFLKDEARRNKEEWDYIARFARSAHQIEDAPVTPSTLRITKKDMKIPYLRKIIDKNKDRYDVYWAKRLLTEIYLKFSRAGSHYLEKGDYQRAILYLELVLSTGYNNWPVHLDLARAYSLEGSKKKAIENLQLAFEKGFNDLKAIENDKALEPLKEEKEYQELLVEWQQKPSSQKEK